MSKQNKQPSPNKQMGFTLVELLLAMACTAIVLSAIYSTYKSQQDSYVVQEQVADMQQNLRAAFYMITRDIRMAGYDPAGTVSAGFVVDLLGDNNGQGATTNANNIAFTIDRDGSAIVDDNNNEQGAYRLNAGALQKYSASSNGWQTVANNIDALDFAYLDPSGTDITGGVAGTPNTIYGTTGLPFIRSVRSIQITMVARAGRIDRDYIDTQPYLNQQPATILPAQNDNFRRRRLTTTIRCRNMGI